MLFRSEGRRQGRECVVDKCYRACVHVRVHVCVCVHAHMHIFSTACKTIWYQQHPYQYQKCTMVLLWCLPHTNCNVAQWLYSSMEVNVTCVPTLPIITKPPPCPSPALRHSLLTAPLAAWHRPTWEGSGMHLNTFLTVTISAFSKYPHLCVYIPHYCACICLFVSTRLQAL